MCHVLQQMLSAVSPFLGPNTTREWERVTLTKISLGSEHNNVDYSCFQRLSADRTPGQEQTMLCSSLHQGFLEQDCAFAWLCGVCDTMAVLFAQMFVLPLEEVRGRSPEPAWSP